MFNYIRATHSFSLQHQHCLTQLHEHWKCVLLSYLNPKLLQCNLKTEFITRVTETMLVIDYCVFLFLCVMLVFICPSISVRTKHEISSRRKQMSDVGWPLSDICLHALYRRTLTWTITVPRLYIINAKFIHDKCSPHRRSLSLYRGVAIYNRLGG